MLLPPALGFSPHPPVSVYGTGTRYTIAAFLGSRNRMLRYFTSLRVTASDCEAGLPSSLLPRLPRASHPRAMLSFCVPTVLITRGTGISTCCPSATLLSLALGPTYPEQISFTLESLDIRPGGFPLHLATHSGILSSYKSTAPYRYCFASIRMLLYQPFRFLSFGGVFQPRTFSAQDSRLVSYYALFECVAASKPTS